MSDVLCTGIKSSYFYNHSFVLQASSLVVNQNIVLMGGINLEQLGDRSSAAIGQGKIVRNKLIVLVVNGYVHISLIRILGIGKGDLDNT